MGRRYNQNNFDNVYKRNDQRLKKKAKLIVPKIIINDLPSFQFCKKLTGNYYNVDPDSLTYGAILAHTRHTYTNYDELCQICKEADIFSNATMADYRRRYDRKIMLIWDEYKNNQVIELFNRNQQQCLK